MQDSNRAYFNQNFWGLVAEAGNPQMPSAGEQSSHELLNGDVVTLYAYPKYLIAASTRDGRACAHFRQEIEQ